MNDWFETEVAIDARAAAAIAHGMRAVARADGVIHQRELALIAAFESDLSGNARVDGGLDTPELRVAYVRSLIMVALADGVISDPELAQIRELSTSHGIDDDAVDNEVLSVKRRFLSVFAGVNVFRDAVVRIARDLGLSDVELDALSQGA